MFLFQCSYHTIFLPKCKRQIALPYIYKFRPYISKIWHIYAKIFLDKKYHLDKISQKQKRGFFLLKTMVYYVSQI